MNTFYQHLIVGGTAFLILMAALAGEFMNGPTGRDNMPTTSNVDVPSWSVAGSYYGQPISERTGQRMVPYWRSAQW